MWVRWINKIDSFLSIFILISKVNAKPEKLQLSSFKSKISVLNPKYY